MNTIFRKPLVRTICLASGALALTGLAGCGGSQPDGTGGQPAPAAPVSKVGGGSPAPSQIQRGGGNRPSYGRPGGGYGRPGG